MHMDQTIDGTNNCAEQKNGRNGKETKASNRAAKP